MQFLAPSEGESGEAADTGSACHAAVATFHRKKGVAEALQIMREKLKEYPRADLQDAANMFLAYSSDPRNATADVVLVEQPIAFSIQASDQDPTGAPIEVIGTLDQVRRENGRLKLWDTKTSKKDPNELLLMHRMQGAAYCVGATVLLGEPVHPGGIICPRKYKSGSVATSPVFWHFPWSLEDTQYILEPLRDTVANIRAGRVTHVANSDCTWCAARTPDLCLPQLKKALPLLQEAARA